MSEGMKYYLRIFVNSGSQDTFAENKILFGQEMQRRNIKSFPVVVF
jgi:hypothetical protein